MIVEKRLFRAVHDRLLLNDKGDSTGRKTKLFCSLLAHKCWQLRYRTNCCCSYLQLIRPGYIYSSQISAKQEHGVKNGV